MASLASIIFSQTFRLIVTVYLIVTHTVHYFIHVLIQPLAAIHNKPLLFIIDTGHTWQHNKVNLMPWPTSFKTVRAWRWGCLFPAGYRTPVSSSSRSLLVYISSFRCSCAIVCVDFWFRFSNAALTRCACWRSTLESSTADRRRYSLTFSARNETARHIFKAFCIIMHRISQTQISVKYK